VCVWGWVARVSCGLGLESHLKTFIFVASLSVPLNEIEAKVKDVHVTRVHKCPAAGNLSKGESIILIIVIKLELNFIESVVHWFCTIMSLYNVRKTHCSQ